MSNSIIPQPSGKDSVMEMVNKKTDSAKVWFEPLLKQTLMLAYKNKLDIPNVTIKMYGNPKKKKFFEYIEFYINGTKLYGHPQLVIWCYNNYQDFLPCLESMFTQSLTRTINTLKDRISVADVATLKDFIDLTFKVSSVIK